MIRPRGCCALFSYRVFRVDVNHVMPQCRVSRASAAPSSVCFKLNACMLRGRACNMICGMIHKDVEAPGV